MPYYPTFDEFVTLAMRTGADPAAVFDALLARGQIRLHPDVTTLQQAIAAAAARHHRRGEHVTVVVDTREQAADLNAAIRERRVADGRVADGPAAMPLLKFEQRAAVGVVPRHLCERKLRFRPQR